MQNITEQETQTIELKIPNVGDTASIELLEWHVREEQSFAAGDELCDLVTDKAAFSLEAPQAGKMLKIFVDKQNNVKVGDIVAQIRIAAQT